MPAQHYSPYAIEALEIAHAIARQNKYLTVETEHVFLGIYQIEEGLGYQLLTEHLSISSVELAHLIASFHTETHKNTAKIVFSSKLREALNWAEYESSWLHNDYLGTEHLLLGILKFSSKILQNILDILDVPAKQIQTRAHEMLHSGINEINRNTNAKRDKLSELGKRVLRAAEQIAEDYGSSTLAPQHLLLALARERRSIVHQILPECGLDTVSLLNDLEQLPARSFPSHTIVNHFLDNAVRRAEALGMHYTGTEHILLAMADDPTGQELLANYGVDNYYLQDYLQDTMLS